MNYQGKTQLTLVIVSPAEHVAEGDRIFADHREWIARTHHREGDKALHLYTVSKAPEMTNPMDPGSEPTGATCFVLTEIYETGAGVADHFEQAASWSEFNAFLAWLGNCRITGVTGAGVVNSLW